MRHSLSLIALFAGFTLMGCAQSAVESYNDLPEAATHTAAIKDAAGTLSLTVADRAKFAVRNGQRVLVINATANRYLSDVDSFVPEGAFGQANVLSARKFEVLVAEGAEMNSVLSGTPLFVKITPSVSGSKTVYARLQLAPSFTSFKGDSAIWIAQDIQAVYVRSQQSIPVRYRGKVSTSSSAVDMQVLGDSEPTVTRIDSRHFSFDWPLEDFEAAADSSRDSVEFLAQLSSGAEKNKTASIAVNVTALDLTTGDPVQTWPAPSCDQAVRECIESLPATAPDYADCGDYRAVSICGVDDPGNATGELSALFPPTSQFIRPLEMAWVPSDTDLGDIEEESHVVDYRTADGRHSCELWWTGGDGGTPILSYLVDESGAYYLATLSQPRVDGDKPFLTVEDAAQSFTTLAEEHYAAVDAARAFFATTQFDEFVGNSLPDGGRIDARVGFSGRVGVPEEVLEAFDFYYRVENADWGSVSLHHGSLAGHAVYVVYTSTDGDDAWLEVFSDAGTPVVSARLWAGEILGWDEFFGRGRHSTGLESLWTNTVTEGYSEPAEREAAGQIPLDWTPTVTLGEGTISSHSGQLTTVDLTSPVALSSGQRELAYAAMQIVWTRTLQYRGSADEPLQMAGQGALRIGTFTSPLDGKNYLVADWKDIDDASYTFYFQQQNDLLWLSIEQYNN